MVFWGNRIQGELTAVHHSENVFAKKLKVIRSGFIRISSLLALRWRRSLPDPQDSCRQDRCDIEELPHVGRARSFIVVGHREKIRQRMAIDCGLGTFVAELGRFVYLPKRSSS